VVRYSAGAPPPPKAPEEIRAAERLFGMLPDEAASEMRALWDEYEAQQSPEARFAKAMDRLMPLLHNALGGARTWRELGVVEQQVRDINRPIERASKTLWRFVSETLDQAVSDGLLPNSPAEPPADPPTSSADRTTRS
jgi:putative hydrolase of HD superfamily